MKVAIFVSLSVLMWSLYPLLSVWALNSMNPFSMMLIVQFIAFHGALLLAIFALAKKRHVRKYFKLQQEMGSDGWMTIVIAGACSAFSHIFFVIALGMANKSGISLVFEIWPLLAVFFTPYMIDKEWKKTRRQDYLIGTIALVGVALIAFSDENIGWFQEEWKLESILAYGMVILASYMTAILSLMRTQYANKLQQRGLNNSFASVVISETLTRFIAVVFILIAIFGMGEELQAPTDNFGLLFIIGFGIFVIGGSSFSYAILKSKSPNIHLFYYLVPVFAVVWLVIAQESQVTFLMVTGGVITILACVYLVMDAKYKEVILNKISSKPAP